MGMNVARSVSSAVNWPPIGVAGRAHGAADAQQAALRLDEARARQLLLRAHDVVHGAHARRDVLQVRGLLLDRLVLLLMVSWPTATSVSRPATCVCSSPTRAVSAAICGFLLGHGLAQALMSFSSPATCTSLCFSFSSRSLMRLLARSTPALISVMRAMVCSPRSWERFCSWASSVCSACVPCSPEVDVLQALLDRRDFVDGRGVPRARGLLLGLQRGEVGAALAQLLV